MKHQSFGIHTNRNTCVLARRIAKFGVVAAQAALISLGTAIAAGQEVDTTIDDQGAQVLTRGPVHEAFAGIVSYNPEPGVIVEKAPPEAIEELPPEIRPAGDNISWIPGYCAWDDERSDYLWISGTWRALPPGRQWTTGYWSTSGQGHQWISGYWADSTLQETIYLPKPPVTVEAGPNNEAPSADHAWTPGSWMWNQDRYAWKPGYWAEGRSDWDWVPSHYVWTPRGYVFVDGYWDYSFDRRGVLYAPVYFQSGYQSRPGYSYSPAVAIGLVAMMEHLFLRPNYHHYYFGDYYDRRYRNNGYYSPYAYQSSRYGYDPVYSHRRWTHREDREWERRYEASYDYRRDHESARPPRTWADQKRLRLDAAETREQQLLMATPFDQMAKQKENLVRIEQVSAKEREKYTNVSREVRKTREERRTLETAGIDTGSGKSEREIKPTKLKLPTSPIVGKSPDHFDKKQAPPKPKRSSIAEPDKERSDRGPAAEKIWPESKIQPEPKRHGDKPTRQESKAKEPKREPRWELRQPKKNAPARAREESKPHESGKRNEDAVTSSSGEKSEPDKEDAEQSTGKGHKK